MVSVAADTKPLCRITSSPRADRFLASSKSMSAAGCARRFEARRQGGLYPLFKIDPLRLASGQSHGRWSAGRPRFFVKLPEIRQNLWKRPRNCTKPRLMLGGGHSSRISDQVWISGPGLATSMLAGYSAAWWRDSFGNYRSQVQILLPRPPSPLNLLVAVRIHSDHSFGCCSSRRKVVAELIAHHASGSPDLALFRAVATATTLRFTPRS